MDKEAPLQQATLNKAKQAQQTITANSQELGAIKSRNKSWSKHQDQRPRVCNKGSKCAVIKPIIVPQIQIYVYV
jgi:hypothetical protein